MLSVSHGTASKTNSGNYCKCLNLRLHNTKKIFHDIIKALTGPAGKGNFYYVYMYFLIMHSALRDVLQRY